MYIFLCKFCIVIFIEIKIYKILMCFFPSKKSYIYFDGSEKSRGINRNVNIKIAELISKNKFSKNLFQLTEK